MKIIADEKIPCIQEYFGGYGELVLKPGRSIQRADVVDADMLIVRSVTQVNAALLEGSAVKFVGSTSTGTDHLDLLWLEQAGVTVAPAAGNNAVAVGEYVVCVIAALQKMESLNRDNLRAAVIGAGHIGSKVAVMLQVLGFEVILCDPPRAQTEKDFQSVPLSAIENCDLICLHTPLTRSGDYPTHHMINKDFLLRQKKNTVLLSAGRGAVIDFSDLKEYGETLYWCLDVWENEPLIDVPALEMSTIATPHIAGHSLQAKQRGCDMVYRAACDSHIISPLSDNRVVFPTQTIACANAKMDWRDVVLKIYDPRVTTTTMQQVFVETAETHEFDRLRNDMHVRHEFEFVTIEQAQINQDDKALLQKLRLKI